MAAHGSIESRNIRSAFDSFDINSDGTVTVDELVTVLTRDGTGKTMTTEDAEEFISLFDKDPTDGKLNIKEFTAAWAQFGAFLREQQEAFQEERRKEEEKRYDEVCEPHLGAIKDLFERLDRLPSDGHLTAKELKDVVTFYEGSAFDEEAFFSWYDSHHVLDGPGDCSGPDGKVDVRECVRARPRTC